MTRESLVRKFPSLRDSRFRITSESTSRYTCIAWAAGDDSKVWLPDRLRIFYWPEDVPRDDTLPAWIALFEWLGYQICETTDIDARLDKIAIYVDSSGAPQHVARQLPSGAWTSKIGTSEDIEHALDGLKGERYGSVAVLMSRPRDLN